MYDIDRSGRPLYISGRSCDDYSQLRFARNAPWMLDEKLSVPEIFRRTTAAIRIDPQSPAHLTITAEQAVWNGYIVFTAPGRWLIQVTDRDAERVVGWAVVELVAGQ